MSYDLTFKPGKNAPLSLKQQDALATALCTIHRPFKRTKLNFAQIAKQLKMTEVAARKQFSDCELTDTKSGIQVILTLKEASLTVPYSLKPKKAQDVFTIVAKIGEAFAEAGFTCRDPQLNRKVNFEKDIDAMLESYSTTANAVTKLTDADFAVIIREAITQAGQKNKTK